jgi:hypothetical protein
VQSLSPVALCGVGRPAGVADFVEIGQGLL